MATTADINALIRLRLKTIRRSRQLNMRQVASRAGIPISTYSNIETGITGSVAAAKLFQILEAMGAEASDVWPYANLSEILQIERDRDLRHQEFRISELAQMFRARSTALLVLEEGRASILLSAGLSPETELRVASYLELGSDPGGETYLLLAGGKKFILMISGPGRDLGRTLVDYFLERFAKAFSEDALLLEAAKDRHPQP